MNSSTNFIQNLPRELIRRVFDNLDSNTDKITCQAVTKRWTEEARNSLIRHIIIGSRPQYKRICRYLSKEENQHKFRLIKSVTFGKSVNAERRVRTILTIDLIHFIRRLSSLEELVVQDQTVCVSTFRRSKVARHILINCPKFKNFTVNKRNLAYTHNEHSYHAILRALKTVLVNVVLMEREKYRLVNGCKFLVGFNKMTRLDIRGISYFQKNPDCVQCLLERPGLTVLYDLPEQQ